MSKKYLSLDEAARLLSIPTDELVRLRERGEIRGFADRGTWKFRQEDVETVMRQRQADSNPEVPLFVEDDDDFGEDVLLVDDSSHDVDLLDSENFGRDSDSDVKLVGNENLDLDLDSDGDSDVKLVGLDRAISDLGEGTDPEIPILAPDSDSDVQLVRPDSDSDVKLPTDDSDSDVKLVGGEDSPTDPEFVLPGGDVTDEDLALFLSDDDQKSSDSDVKINPAEATLIGMNEPLQIDLDDDAEIQLNTESGIELSSGSSALLSEESGINLEGPSDSGIALGGDDDDEEGITLALDYDSGISLDTGDSGISLETGDSGISLESIGDSGISLDDSVGGGTIPMMDATGFKDDVPETQFEIPSLADDDSNYELQMDDDETGVLDVQDEGDSAFDLGDDDTTTFESDNLDFEEDSFDAEEELDVFDADEDVFGDVDGDQEFAAPVAGRVAVAEQEWGTMTFVLLTVASLFMVVCGAVMIDLVKNTATSAQANPVSGMILDTLGGLYK